MEVLFENKYVRDKEWAKHSYGYMYFRRPFLILCYIYFLVVLLWGLYKSVFNGYFDILVYKSIFNGYFNTLVIVIPILLASGFWRYKQSVKISLLRDIETFGKPIEVTVAVTNEEIMQTSSSGSNLSLKFYDIKKAVYTKKYIYIITNANIIYTFKNDGFTVGDKDRFLDFLRMKGVKVK